MPIAGLYLGAYCSAILIQARIEDVPSRRRLIHPNANGPRLTARPVCVPFAGQVGSSRYLRARSLAQCKEGESAALTGVDPAVNKEVEYRSLFENFVQDLLSTVNKPEWPAAELLLFLLGTLLVQNFSTENVDVPLEPPH